MKLVQAAHGAMVFELARLAVLTAAVQFVPLTPTVRDDVDTIELNHVYDGDGRLILSQLIFWNWNEHSARPHVVAWRLWKPGQPTPLRDWLRGGYVLWLRDGQTLREIRSPAFRETWTQFDPEIQDRSRLSQDRRRGLRTAQRPPQVR